jgi:hypothetical protein
LNVSSASLNDCPLMILPIAISPVYPFCAELQGPGEFDV